MLLISHHGSTRSLWNLGLIYGYMAWSTNPTLRYLSDEIDINDTRPTSILILEFIEKDRGRWKTVIDSVVRAKPSDLRFMNCGIALPHWIAAGQPVYKY